MDTQTNKFTNFLDNFRASNPSLVETIESGYHLIFEGKSDVIDMTEFKNIFDDILTAISQMNSNEEIVNGVDLSLSKHGIITDNTNHESGRPLIHFNPSTKKNRNGYSEEQNYLMVDISRNAQLYEELLKSRDYKSIAKLLTPYLSTFIHEMNHYKDAQYEGDRKKQLKNHNIDKNVMVNTILKRIGAFFKGLDEEGNVIDQEKDYHESVDYYNENTERNSRILQHMWESIERLSKGNTSMTFKEFIQPIKREFGYYTESSQKRIIKRFFYVWEAIRNAYSDLKVFNEKSLDNIKNKLLNLNESIGKTFPVSNLTESASEWAVMDIMDPKSIDNNLKNDVDRTIYGRYLAISDTESTRFF